ncbi:MAG: restriction endonuclease subunit S [Treponema sp.]|nr:restriction endonuclease subunit S [Treponema sp.]
MEVRFNQIMKIKHGYAFEGESYSDEPTKWSLLTPANFTLSGGFQETDRYYKEDGASFPSEFILSKDDLIVTMTDLSKEIDTIGYGALVPADNKYLHNQRIGLVTITDDRIDKYYLYWLMRTKFYQRFVAGSSNGATVHHTSPDRIMKFKWNFPPLPTQQKIASILSAYDNLIQNYKKQIEALQTAASELYKEWFVRFRFPGYQTAEFENGIPEGWKVERIGALYDSTSGGTPSREHEEYFQNGVYPWIKTGELKDCPIIETEESITDEAIKHSSAKLFEKDSLIIAMYGATIGQLGINKMKATCNQACCVLRPKKDKAFGIYYLFHFFKENREFIIGLGNGAAQQNLSQVLINKLKIVNPNKEILEIFEKKESLFFEKIYHLQQQITNLTQQRDLLLPRLMSGKLEVE